MTLSSSLVAPSIIRDLQYDSTALLLESIIYIYLSIYLIPILTLMIDFTTNTILNWSKQWLRSINQLSETPGCNWLLLQITECTESIYQLTTNACMIWKEMGIIGSWELGFFRGRRGKWWWEKNGNGELIEERVKMWNRTVASAQSSAKLLMCRLTIKHIIIDTIDLKIWIRVSYVSIPRNIGGVSIKVKNHLSEIFQV